MHYKPSVSIIITCYNYAKYVEQAITSVYEQTHLPIQVIVINDGSTDNSDDTIKVSQKKHGFEYINQENKGVVFARNTGKELVKGEFTIFLDADDRLPPDYILKLVECAAKVPAVDIFYTEAVNLETREVVIKPVEYNLEHIKHSNFIHSSSMVRTKALARYTYDPNLNRLGYEDWDLYLGMCLGGSTAHLVRGVSLDYRIHDGGISRGGGGHVGLESVKAVTYIYSKYTTIYPSEMELLSLPLLNLSISLEAIENMEQEREKISEKLDNLQRYKDETSHSVSYRIAKLIVWLPRIVKKAIKRTFGR